MTTKGTRGRFYRPLFYNANGIRTAKLARGQMHNYMLEGAKILRESWIDYDSQTEFSIVPIYDNDDSVGGIIYNGTPYYFYKNLQGDIIAILDKDGEVVVRYSYDAWGARTVVQNTAVDNVAYDNPFLYRGYYYDTETDFYYLQSRYYDPTTGRFINGDSAQIVEQTSDTQLLNVYSYCHNDPVNEVDRTAQIWASKLAEIFLSLVMGMVAQLFDDLIIYFIQVLVYGKKKVKFNPNPSDYIKRGLEWALDCINPFSGKLKILSVIFAILPVIVKTIWDLVAGRGFNLWNFLKSIIFSLLAIIISKVLGFKAKREISKIKGNFKGRKPAFKAEQVKINTKFNVLGNKITPVIVIGASVVDAILTAIFKF